MQSSVILQVSLSPQVLNNKEKLQLFANATEIFEKELAGEKVMGELQSPLPAD